MDKSKISIIVAAAGKKRVIGTKGGMVWYIPQELKRFKEITMGHPIIMGRKTHESIGKALPGRTNIIVTRHKVQVTSNGVIVVTSLEEALRQAKSASGNDEIFIIGGGQIYQEAINLADKLYLTYLDKEVEGDVFFPDIDPAKWKETAREDHGEYSFVTYVYRS